MRLNLTCIKLFKSSRKTKMSENSSEQKGGKREKINQGKISLIQNICT